jgi:hypothetical protein
VFNATVGSDNVIDQSVQGTGGVESDLQAVPMVSHLQPRHVQSRYDTHVERRTAPNTPAFIDRPLWKRVFVRAAIGGSALAIVLLAGMATITWYVNRPKEWNAYALKAVRAHVSPSVQLNEKLDEVSSGINIDADIQNTRSDIRLPADLKVQSVTKNTNALQMTHLNLRREYFIPAQHTVTVTVDSADLCAANQKPRDCFNTYFGDASALVIFDERSRYKIEIPIPAFTWTGTDRK